jgi:hypothetical protein
VADWVCGRCTASNREQVVTCANCGGARGAIAVKPNTLAGSGPATPALAGAGAGALGQAPALAVDTPALELPARKPALPAEPQHIVGAVLGGAIGAALATAIWYGVVAATSWQVGLIAIAVGFVVGQGVVFGANGRGSVLFIPVSLAFTLVALVASEYLIAVHFVNQAAVEIGVPASELLALFSPVDLVRISLEEEPITLLFWAIAGYEAFVIPMRAGRGGQSS